MTDRSLPSGFRFAVRLRLARAALFWERLWPALWPALAVLGVFFVLVFFDLLPLLPSLVHAAVLLALGAAFIVALAKGVRGVAVPDIAVARHRLERASGLRHRPLQALADRPVGPPDGPAMRLWEAHLRRMAVAARGLRVGLPAAGLAARDPRGLRAALTILLLIGAIDAGGDWSERLDRALTPELAATTPAVAATMDIWVNPPEYTGLPPQFLRPGDARTVEIPLGSKLLAQVHGGGAVPRLMIDDKAQKFDAVDKANFRISVSLSAGKRLSVAQGDGALGSWPIAIIPDLPPTIAFAKPPRATAQRALRLDYRASDDYGVESVEAVIRRAGGKPGEKLELALPLPGLHLKQAKATSYHDLTSHPWAGLPVEIRLVATDAVGHRTESAPVRFTLPERVFHNPVARAIIEQRKRLVTDPSARVPVAEVLGDLRTYTHMYRDDAVVFLGLRVAEQQLRHDRGAHAVAEVEQLLWDTALRIEDGGASIAERELRRIERELQDALARNAPDAEIDRLMQQLQQALQRYLRGLAQNLARHPQQARPIDPSRALTGRDLQRMLDRMRALAQSGQRDKARELLSQLQNMLENLRAGRMPQQGLSEAQQMMRNMQQLMQRQQKLLDRSFRAEQQSLGRMGRPGQQQPGGKLGQQQPGGQFGQQQPGNGQFSEEMGDAAGQQEALRRMLGDVMRRLGDETGSIPDPFGRAERAMHDAVGALRQNQPGQAIGPQTEALDQLQQGARDFARRMEQRMGRRGLPGEMRPGLGSRAPGIATDRDPFGRPTSSSGFYDEGDVKIPDQMTLDKARRILDELRRRAGQRFRPEIEREYIDRLLKRF